MSKVKHAIDYWEMIIQTKMIKPRLTSKKKKKKKKKLNFKKEKERKTKFK